MKANFHTHSVYSDGADTLTELVEAAIEKGFGALGFSEHSYTYFDESYCMSRENTLRYISEVRALQEKYRGRIALYLGIEQDFYSTESVDNYEYVIGSVHYLKKGGHFLPVDESAEDLARFRDMYYEGDIYALIIPIQYHVTKKEIQTMAQAENMEQVYGVIKNSWYKCQNIEELMDQGLGNAAKELTDKIYELTSRKEPYSAAVLNSYLYFKEREIEQIITTIEKIRYGMTART